MPAKGLIRMLGPRRDLQARNLSGRIGHLQKQAVITRNYGDTCIIPSLSELDLSRD